MLKSTPCSSSHELDEMSNVLRKMALTAEFKHYRVCISDHHRPIGRYLAGIRYLRW